MGKYLLENIRAQYPKARCAIVVGSRGGMIRDLLAAYPWIEVIEANRRSPAALLRLYRAFRGSELVVMPYTGGVVTLPTKLMARLIAKRGALVGYADRSGLSRYICDTLLPLPLDRSRAPRLLEHDALDAAAIPVSKDALTFQYVEQPRLLERLGVRAQQYVIVGLFSGGAEARGLTPGNRQRLVDDLHRAFPSVPLVFTGTRTERERIMQLRLPTDSLVADTTVQELAALIDHARGVVSLGTGTSHIASMLGRPLVVLAACQGLQWVGEAQYGDAPIAVFSRPEYCPGGHDYSTFGRCINAVDCSAVAARAKTMFDL